jgi:hypothetical protein
MAMSAAQIGRVRPAGRSVAESGARSGVVSVARLIAIGAAVAIPVPLVMVSVFALLVAVLGGSPALVAGIMALALPFVAITIPTTAIWLIGAIQTGRTIRRLADQVERDDRAACAELNALLEGE